MGIGLIFSYIGQFLGGPITAITGQVASYFTSAKNVEATEFASMTSAERDEYIAALTAQTNLNQAKIANKSTASNVMVFAFGLPPAIYLGAVYIDSFFGGGHIVAAPARFEQFAFDIGKSFFILAPTLALGGPIVTSLASRLRAR